MSELEIEIIKNAGVVGAGGAGFPTHIKLNTQIETLIINGAECEPLINVDKQLLQFYFDKVYKGIKVAASVTKAKKIVLALKEKHKEAVKAVENFTQQEIKFELFKLDNFYPAGDEQVLVYEVTGKIVPEGGIPLQVGVVVINVETLLNIYKATCGENVTDKYVTVNGGVKNPLTLMVPVGTPVKKLIDFCGGVTLEEYSCFDGGPMMGKLINEDTYAVKKTTKSVIVLPEDNIVVQNKKRDLSDVLKRAQAICMSCRMCTDMCPRYLLGHDLFPDELMKRIFRGELSSEDLEKYDCAYLCCDCGLCELYGCMMDLSPRSLFNYIKSELERMGIKNSHNRSDLEVNEFREYRKVPVDRLEKRLEIDMYDSKTPLTDFSADVDEVKLYLSQHAGIPAESVVKVGDSVKTGDLIADIPEGKLGAKIHSSISGKVKQLNSEYVLIERF